MNSYEKSKLSIIAPTQNDLEWKRIPEQLRERNYNVEHRVIPTTQFGDDLEAFLAKADVCVLILPEPLSAEQEKPMAEIVEFAKKFLKSLVIITSDLSHISNLNVEFSCILPVVYDEAATIREIVNKIEYGRLLADN